MWIQLSVVYIVIFCGVNSATVHKLPESFPLCKNDAQIAHCLLHAITEALKALKDNGIPELGVPSLDPLHTPGLEVGQGQGPISINLKFRDIVTTGFSKATITDTRDIDLKAVVMHFKGAADLLEFVSDYEMSGRILLLPITGTGRCKLTFKNVTAIAGLSGKIIQKKGKSYLNVIDFKLDVTSIDHMQVHFENLFNGNNALGDSMNALLNENWRDLWIELKQPIVETLTALFLQYSKRIFEKVAFNDIFIDP